MKSLRLTFAVLVLLVITNSARAQNYISWTTGFPAAGSTKGFKVDGLITPGAYTVGDVTLTFWPSNGMGKGTMEAGTTTILAKDLTDNKNKTFSFSLDNISKDIQATTPYNITATVKLYIGGMLAGQARTQPVVKTSK